MKKFSIHAKISFLKSTIRMFGFFLLLFCLPVAVAFLVFAEMVGIAEEIYGD